MTLLNGHMLLSCLACIQLLVILCYLVFHQFLDNRNEIVSTAASSFDFYMQVKLREMKPGTLSHELKEALGMPEGAPPPWLINMQVS